MLHKCANAACVRLFRSMGEGKLFHIAAGTVPLQLRGGRRKYAGPRAQHYWLCDDCAGRYTLTFADSAGLVAVPLPQKNPGRAHIEKGVNDRFAQIPAGAN